MVKISASLDHLFTERPLLERFVAANVAGFEMVEMRSPYDAAAQDMAYQLVMRDLAWAALEAPPPNYTGGEPGWAASPAQKERFTRDLRRALRFADVLKSRFVTIAAGPDAGAQSHDCFVENLILATTSAPKRRFLIAPDDPDLEGAFLTSHAQAAEILTQVGADNLFLCADLAQATQECGGQDAVLERFGAHMGCLRLSTRPDKQAHDALLDRLDKDGFSGYVSAAYRPQGPTEDSLEWFTPPPPSAPKAAKKASKASPRKPRAKKKQDI
ncbi:hypothetical protein BFP70_01100 [Thioclava sp. SK-1]|uniref:TIM barrel protein n=1 Tax=Thioclava sp. SK-1 TaxID=1889770 RepID=UPI000824AEA1|nr:TIM barrel protein [Thioclava sp. SK-1]OCX66781.1 hypothetical protein BFP70_01100 [Thioclava sp. SK-1]